MAALMALLGALCIQVGTNFCNDYADFVRGADKSDRKGPLRMTQAGLVSVKAMRRAAVIAFLLAVLCGVFLIARGGWIIAAIGVASIISGIGYTVGKYPLAYLGLGDVFVLIFFGPVAVGGTYYVQTLEINASVLTVGAAVGLLTTAILLVNNIRDIEEDRRAGKRTLAVRFGRRVSVVLWAVCVTVAALIPLEILVATAEHQWAALTLLIIIPGLAIYQQLRTTTSPKRFNALLGFTGLLLFAHAVLFSVGWILG